MFTSVAPGGGIHWEVDVTTRFTLEPYPGHLWSWPPCLEGANHGPFCVEKRLMHPPSSHVPCGLTNQGLGVGGAKSSSGQT